MKNLNKFRIFNIFLTVLFFENVAPLDAYGMKLFNHFSKKSQTQSNERVPKITT